MSSTQTLVNELERKMKLSPEVRRAFLSVDRAIFVPEYFAHEGKAWEKQSAGNEVYQDRALVTRIDEAGMPCSSSSQPSVMAAMLQALKLQPGQRVLEIGAGTGYNAALLATTVGSEGYVISVEIDEELAQKAQQRLAKLEIHNIEVVVGDGAKGYSKAAHYDRIIATAGFRQIPQEWKDQLTTGGIIVGNLLGNLASVLVQLEKQKNETFRGSILPQDAFFMEMRGGDYRRVVPFDWTPYDAAKEESEASCEIHRLLRDQRFLLWLEQRKPALQKRARPGEAGIIEHWFLDPESHSSIITSPRGTKYRGRLIEELRDAQSTWRREINIGNITISL